ncbi:MAG TPA: cyanophycin synthetase [Pirellulales bacterium]|nr:cyanophycin synthetase [Pirellulales bacterium]
MEILNVLALRGPNIWANFPVLEARVDLGELKDSPSHQLPGFNQRLMAWLPSMIEHRCGLGKREGFFDRLRGGTYMAHILEHVTLELQTLAGCEVGYGRARETSAEGVYKVVIEYDDEAVARACLATAFVLCLAAVDDRPFDISAEVARLRELSHELRLGPSTRSIVDAAKRRGIPARRLNAGNLVQLGHGARQRRVIAAETDRTTAIAESIAQDKELTRTLLRSVGVPVPEGRPVESAGDAWEAARELGTPVVVKPRYGNQGRGVATHLATEAQVTAAYEAARKESSSIVVERQVEGADYRLLVVGDRLVAAARREGAQVVGDGARSVAELVDDTNADPRRGSDHATPLSRVRLDAISLGVLAEQGLSPEAVPAAGRRVLVRRNGNLSTGGTATDVTDLVHPQVAERAIEAARMIGLDVAGIDLLTRDVGRPLEEQGGAVVEVNACPGLRMHLEPSAGRPRPVGDAIVDALFAPGENGRVPLVSVTGTNGKTTTTRFIAHLLETKENAVGMACTDGIFIAGRRIDTGDCSGPQSARAVLLNPKVDAAVLETARGGILREGLGFDRCDVAVVTNLAEGDHLGVGGAETLEDLARIKRCVVEAVAADGTAVLKGDDPLVAAMAQKCAGSVIFFAQDENHPVIGSHRDRGERVLFVREGRVVASEGPRETVVAELARAPLTHGGRIGFQVENTLAAVAAAWALGTTWQDIRDGLESFVGGLSQVPGRFNMLAIGETTVVLDYGHNSSALAAVVEAVEQCPHLRRSVVYSTAGDRRDEDIVRQGELLGDTFDHVILYEGRYKRGRADGEIMALFRRGLETGGRVAEVREVQGALAALEFGLHTAQPGELLMIQADAIDETVRFLQDYLARRQHGHEISWSEVLNVSSDRHLVR